LFYLKGVDGKFRTNHGAEFAVDTILFPARNNLGIVVSLSIGPSRFFQHLFGAEVDAQIAPFAALRDQVYLTERQFHFIYVYGGSCEDSHKPLHEDRMD